MQFTVPQFIDIESKIIGPVSVRQFVIMLLSGVLIYINYEIFGNINFWFFALSSVGIFAFFGTLAFLRINGRPFHYFMLNLFNAFKDPRLRVWSKQFSKDDIVFKKEKIQPPKVIPKKKPLSLSRLTRLSLIVDTGGAYKEDRILEESSTDYTLKKKEEEE